MAVNNYQELLLLHSTNNELQVRKRSIRFDLKIFISGITRTIVTQGYIQVVHMVPGPLT